MIISNLQFKVCLKFGAYDLFDFYNLGFGAFTDQREVF